MAIRSNAHVEQVRTLFTFEQSVLARLRVVVAQKGAELAQKARSLGKGRIGTKVRLKLVDNDFGIKAVVGNPWYVARFYELGFGGKAVKVRAHTRRVKGLDVKSKVRNAKGRMTTKTIKGTGQVKAYSRNLKRVERPVLKAALEEMRSDVRAALAEAIQGAAHGTR